MKVLLTRINIQKPVLLWGLVLAVAFSACQKDLDYTRPADAGSFEKDKAEAFGNLTNDNGATWAWDARAGLFGNKFGGLIIQFFKDSTANIYGTPARGLVADLQTLRASGTLDADEDDFAAFLIDQYTPFPDALLRRLLDDPANSDFKEVTQYFLPNYEGFNSLSLTGEEGLSFDVNGPVQLSLTFHNSQLLGSLKQTGGLDFDFRLMKSTPDSITLDGYYSNDANKKSMLYKVPLDIPVAFATGSRRVLEVNPTRGRVALRTGGVIQPAPAGYPSGLAYFYIAFDQTFTVKNGYGYVPNGNDLALAPAVLKNAQFVKVKSAFNGNAVAAPVGTVLMTVTVNYASGPAKDVDFVKN